MHRFSNLSDQALRNYLEEIRRIAMMEDNDALKKVDELVCDLALRGGTIFDLKLDDDASISQCNIDVKKAKKELQKFREELKNYRKSVAMGESEDELLGGHFVRELAEEVEIRSCVWPESVREELREEIAEIKHEANQLADEMAIRYYSDVVLASKTGAIFSINSVRGIIETLSWAEAELQKRVALNDNLREEIRREKERCAWFRAKKKLSEMKVAEKSGSRVKAARLKREAQAVLEQDWLEIFRDEKCPALIYRCE